MSVIGLALLYSLHICLCLLYGAKDYEFGGRGQGQPYRRCNRKFMQAAMELMLGKILGVALCGPLHRSRKYGLRVEV